MCRIEKNKTALTAGCMLMLYLAAVICTLASVCPAVLHFTDYAYAAAAETEKEEDHGTGHEVYVSDLTDTLSPEELEQMRESVLSVTQYCDVYLLVSSADMGLDERYKEAFGKKYTDIGGLEEDGGIIAEIIIFDTFASMSLHVRASLFSDLDKYSFIEETWIDNRVGGARLKEGDYVGAVSETFRFVRGFLEMDIPQYENEETGYDAIIADYGGVLTSQEKADLLEQMKGLTAYGGVLLSIGTISDVCDTSGMKCLSDQNVLKRIHASPENWFHPYGYYFAEFNDLDKGSQVHVHIDNGETVIDSEGVIGSLFEMYSAQEEELQAESETEESVSGEKETSPYADIYSNPLLTETLKEGYRRLELLENLTDALQENAEKGKLAEVDGKTREEVIRLTQEEKYARCAGKIFSYMQSCIDRYDESRPADRDSDNGMEAGEDVSHKDEKVIWPAVTIWDRANILTEPEEESLKSVMEPVSAYGKTAFVSYLTNETAKDYVEKNLNREGFFSGGGTVFVIDMYHREIWLYSGGKIRRTVSDSLARAITANVYQYATDGDFLTCAEEAFRQELKLLEGGRITQPMKVACYLLLSVSFALLGGFLIAFRSRTSQKEEIGDLMGGAAAAVGGAAAVTVLKRERLSSQGYYGGSGGSSGRSGGGGGFSGGGHRF